MVDFTDLENAAATVSNRAQVQIVHLPGFSLQHARHCVFMCNLEMRGRELTWLCSFLTAARCNSQVNFNGRLHRLAERRSDGFKPRVGIDARFLRPLGIIHRLYSWPVLQRYIPHTSGACECFPFHWSYRLL